MPAPVWLSIPICLPRFSGLCQPPVPKTVHWRDWPAFSCKMGERRGKGPAGEQGFSATYPQITAEQPRSLSAMPRGQSVWSGQDTATTTCMSIRASVPKYQRCCIRGCAATNLHLEVDVRLRALAGSGYPSVAVRYFLGRRKDGCSSRLSDDPTPSNKPTTTRPIHRSMCGL